MKLYTDKENEISMAVIPRLFSPSRWKNLLSFPSGPLLLSLLLFLSWCLCGNRCYLPGQAITSLWCSSHQQHGFPLLFIPSAAWLPCLLQLVPCMERGPPHTSRVLPAPPECSLPMLYKKKPLKKNYQPFPPQRGSTGMSIVSFFVYPYLFIYLFLSFWFSNYLF